MNGRPAARASAIAGRRRSAAADGDSVVNDRCEATGVGESSLASFNTVTPFGAVVVSGDG